MTCPKCLATIDKYKVVRTKSKMKATCHSCKTKLVQEYPLSTTHKFVDAPIKDEQGTTNYGTLIRKLAKKGKGVKV